jgi:hypothetical protein
MCFLGGGEFFNRVSGTFARKPGKGVRMKKCGVLLLSGGLLALGACTYLMGMQERERIYGPEGPLISGSFASRQARPGDPWKIYLKASDPGGDMDRIVAKVFQPGKGIYPISFTRIKPENGKDLSGFVFLSTHAPAGGGWMDFLEIQLVVQIVDKAGHFSDPVSFSLFLSSRSTQEPPPPGNFKEQNLGPILVNILPIDGGCGDSFL